jgi:hypothetical protein
LLGNPASRIPPRPEARKNTGLSGCPPAPARGKSTTKRLVTG